MPMGAKKISGVIPHAAVFLLLCGLAPVLSEAQTTGPCTETANKYCKDVIPGGGRIMKCLADHRDDQSVACKDWLEDQNRSLKDLNTSCRSDIASLCSFSNPDSMIIYRCLEDNYVSLKSGCREKLREIKDRMK